MTSEGRSAECNAALVLAVHGQQINAAVYVHGQSAIVDTLHALADLIEASEFTFKAEWIH